MESLHIVCSVSKIQARGAVAARSGGSLERPPGRNRAKRLGVNPPTTRRLLLTS